MQELDESLPQAEQFSYPGVLLTMEGAAVAELLVL